MTLTSLSSAELLDLVSAALQVAAPSLPAEQRTLVAQVLDGLLRDRSD